MSTRPDRKRRRIGILLTVAVITAGLAWYYQTTPERSGRGTPGDIGLGRNAPLGGTRLFPDDNPWNTAITDRPVDPLSDSIISQIGVTTTLHPDFGTNRFGTKVYGIPYVVVDGSAEARQRPEFRFAAESDPGPYPIPDNAPIESGGDRHLLIIDRESWRLFELYLVHGSGDNWRAGSGAVFNLKENTSRPRDWTSADAAGLPILPGLVRADEVYDFGEIRHALRFTLPSTSAAYRYPARHHASVNPRQSLLPMGMRLRLKASVDLIDFPAGARVIATALKTYGMMLADNGGVMYLTGTADRRWKRADTQALTRLSAGDFEVIIPPPPPASDSLAQREMKQGLPGFSER